jgi:hypothetical protein
MPNGGYTTEPCDLCESTWHAGAGVQQGLGNKFYVKGEYRHNFERNLQPGSDALVAGRRHQVLIHVTKSPSRGRSGNGPPLLLLAERCGAECRDPR